MGAIHFPKPALLTVPVFSSETELMQKAADALARCWGPIGLASEAFAFTETDYYQTEMGPDLRLQILAFERLIDPATLPEIKLATNQVELDISGAATNASRPGRGVNVDPGYLTEAKFVLATTKDRDHRIYLRDGVFAEITLRYTRGQWRPFEWTYPNYRREDYHAFLAQCREYYRGRLRESR